MREVGVAYFSRYWAKPLFFVFIGLWMSSGCSEDGKGNGEPKDPGNGDVVVKECQISEDTCLSKTEVLHCVEGVRKREYCSENEYCFEGKCGPIICEPNKIESCREDGKFYGCNSVGTGYGEYSCESGKTCRENQCQLRLCQEGSGRCLDRETILLCNASGTEYSVATPCQSIAEKSICENGACISICDQSTKDASYIGCEYWAVDLDNAIDAGVYDAAGQPFAVVLSNTHDKYTANVDVYIKTSNAIKKSLSFSVPPGELKSVYLPDNCYYYNGGACDRAYSVNGTTIVDTAYYIKSDLPITAAQFNPLHNVQVYSNDASLLFPTTALGRRYMIMSREQHYNQFHSFVTVVATQPGQTQVQVKASCNLMDGSDKSGKRIDAMKRGDTQIFYLDQFDVLNLETLGVKDDPTGTLISADQLVAVFAGIEATSLPETDPVTCCADHIEHQQYPMSAWGKTYQAVKLKPRNKERDIWRILARVDKTRIATTPNIFSDGAEFIELNSGQWIDIATRESFTIEATAPVLVGQFMTSQNDPNDRETGTAGRDSAGIGDPSYIIGVPVEQYRTTYQFLTPSMYEEDYITIVAPKGANVQLDGEAIDSSEFFEFGDGSYSAVYRRVEDGPHSIVADKKIGVFSYGFDAYVSYGYPAGLDLREISDL